MQSIPEVEFVEQTEQLGTGHAVQQLLPTRGLQGDLLVLNGDVPLLRPETLKQLLRTHQSIKTPPQFSQFCQSSRHGRVFCNRQNIIKQIVEDRDCNAQNKITASMLDIASAGGLASVLLLQADNDQQNTTCQMQ